jgi:hypothetical protein
MQRLPLFSFGTGTGGIILGDLFDHLPLRISNDKFIF